MLNENKIKILKYTQSICSACLRKNNAEYIEKEGRVYLRKHCPEHKETEVLISRRSSEYKELLSCYSVFGLEDRKVLESQPDQVSIFPTTRCNLSCPVCFSDCSVPDKDVRIDDVSKAIGNLKHKKINILGGEATVYPELLPLIRTITR